MDAIDLRRLRELPLDAVLESFGARRDPKDPRRNWRLDHHRITVTGDKFYDHDSAIGGGGAIDLALHLLGRPPRHPSADDLARAARHLGTTPQPASAAPAPIPIAPQAPAPDLTQLPRVRAYLTQRRAIPGALVERELARGTLFADRHANAVFRLVDETGQPFGFEKRGTGERPFHSVYGHKGLFITGRRDSGTAAFVESAIEALSYVALHGGLAISTTGNAVDLPMRMARHLQARGHRLVAAFNADRDGDRFAQRFIDHLGAVERDRPAGAKDWNQLLQTRRAERARSTGAQTPDSAFAFTR